jgi:branched-chain amino acid transport system substrate-binding protein
MNVALPNGMVMVSPSATSPGLSHNNNEDKGLLELLHQTHDKV